MLAKVKIQMCDGRKATTTTTREALADFWQRNSSSISMAIIDINLIRWFYDKDFGWSKRPKFRYVPGRPDLWRVQDGAGKPTNQTPF